MKKLLARWIVSLLGPNTLRKWAGTYTEPKIDLGMSVRRYEPETDSYGEWEDLGIVASNHRPSPGTATVTA